jgi:hypothetical protein
MADVSDWAVSVAFEMWRRGPATERQVAEMTGYSQQVINRARRRLMREGRLRKVRVLAGRGTPTLWGR